MSGCMTLKQKEAIKQQNSNFKSMCFEKKKDRCNVLAICLCGGEIFIFILTLINLHEYLVFPHNFNVIIRQGEQWTRYQESRAKSLEEYTWSHL